MRALFGVNCHLHLHLSWSPQSRYQFVGLRISSEKMIHGKEHLYNAAGYGDIYRYICGGLGVGIS